MADGSAQAIEGDAGARYCDATGALVAALAGRLAIDQLAAARIWQLERLRLVAVVEEHQQLFFFALTGEGQQLLAVQQCHRTQA